MIRKNSKIAGAVLACVLVAGALTGWANPQNEGTEALEQGTYEDAR